MHDVIAFEETQLTKCQKQVTDMMSPLQLLYLIIIVGNVTSRLFVNNLQICCCGNRNKQEDCDLMLVFQVDAQIDYRCMQSHISSATNNQKKI